MEELDRRIVKGHDFLWEILHVVRNIATFTTFDTIRCAKKHRRLRKLSMDGPDTGELPVFRFLFILALRMYKM